MSVKVLFTKAMPGRVASFSALTVLLIGAAVALGLGHPNAPSEAMRPLLPAITLGTVLVAGAVDGINPCAFTVLVLLITSILAAMQTTDIQAVSSVRARIVGLGSIYVASVFLTYLALGAGLLATVDLFSRGHAPARIGALLAVGMGLWMLKDYFVPELGFHLRAPMVVGQWARRWGQKTTVPALVMAGIAIGLCTVPCSGAVYLAVLSMVASQASTGLAYAYLVLYNLMFILPLAVILVAASSRPSLNRLAHWNLHHKETVRLALGLGVIVMGLLILATV